MSQSFRVVEHIISGQHIREYPKATRYRQEDVLQLAVRQYIPLHTSIQQGEDAVTIVGAHGNGFPKETYEPLWDNLHAQLQSRGVRVRGIWIADCSNQGVSGVLNEEIQGDNTSWFDHSRDLLHMINHFREAMPRPLIGVAHSMGCAQLIQLSIMHPRLLSTLVLYEPAFTTYFPRTPRPNPALMSTKRPDIWPSRSAAASAIGRALSGWDPRCASLYLSYGLRAIPTPLYDTARPLTAESAESLSSDAVTLTTTKHQEAWGILQSNLEDVTTGTDDWLLPDWDPQYERPRRWARPEMLMSMRNLPHLRPSVLYVFGKRSYLNDTELQDEMVKTTGTGIGGSGGAAKGDKVKKVVVEKAGHLCVFEREGVSECAQVGAEWIRKWFFGQWRTEETFWQQYSSKKSEGGQMWKISEEWKKSVLDLPADAPRPGGARNDKL